MKIQDLSFFVILALLFYRKDPKHSAVAGLLSLVVAIPLFQLWIFFTAERLTWYAAAFFLLSIFQHLNIYPRKNPKT